MYTLRLFFVSLCLLLVLAFPRESIAKKAEEEISKLTLSAQAFIRKPADELQFKIGVVTLNSEADTALVENSIRMESVIKSLEAAGLERSEYETGHFTVHPTYTPYPKNPPDDWKPSINGYEVTNSILIHTSKLDDAGKLIDAANKGGANKVDNIRFTLHDPHTYRDEAIKIATANALSDAKAIASAAGVRLVRILSINLDSSSLQNPQESTLYFARGADGVPPIEAGEVSLTANVTVVYEIEPN